MAQVIVFVLKNDKKVGVKKMGNREKINMLYIKRAYIMFMEEWKKGIFFYLKHWDKAIVNCSLYD